MREDRSDPFRPGPPCGAELHSLRASVASAEYLVLHTGDVIRLPATKPVTPQRSDAFTRQNKPAAEAADAAAEAADAAEEATRLRLI